MRCVGAGAADAELFQLLDQRRLAEPRGRLGEMLSGADFEWEDRRALRHFGQKQIVAGDAGDTHESIEDQLAAGGAEDRVAARRFGGDSDGGGVEFGRRHLAGDEAVPDQLIQLIFIGPELGVGVGGVKEASVGRMASWASWALLLLEE